MKNFVSFKWLDENLYKENLIVLDVRGDLSDPLEGQKLYEKGHIPNARFVSLEETLTGELGEHGGRHPLPNMESFLKDMKDLGIDNDSTVVIYDDGSLSFAGRLWWLLKYIGKEDVFVLEGGYNDWVRKGGEISVASPLVEKAEDLDLNIQKNIIAEMNLVKSTIDKNNVAIIDSRNHERYTGEVEPLDKKAGRIPSAINYPFGELIEEDFPTVEEIKDHFKELENYDDLILYCGSGISATVNYLFIEEAGLEPKLYPGSFSDWISYEENEIETDF